MQVVDQGEGSVPPLFHLHPSRPPEVRSFPRGMAGCSAAAGRGSGAARPRRSWERGWEPAPAGLEEPRSPRGDARGAQGKEPEGTGGRGRWERAAEATGESGSAGGEARERAWAPPLRPTARSGPSILLRTGTPGPFRPHRLR